MKIGILTSPNQWFKKYAVELSEKLNGVFIYTDDSSIDQHLDILFILGYHRMVGQHILDNNNYNIVIHESALPIGKGWAPLFWQILEGENTIPFSMLEAQSAVDAGPIYMQRNLVLTGYELNSELREKQAQLTIDMCVEFATNMEAYLPPIEQTGDESFYRKRSPSDSKLDLNKSIKEQFNLLRIAENTEYPAYFEIDGHEYVFKIEKKQV
mgnify:CR=1 FL=1